MEHLSCIRLDPVLQKVCKNDAQAVCHASSLEDDDAYPISLVISCLYRNSVLETRTKVWTSLTYQFFLFSGFDVKSFDSSAIRYWSFN